MKCVRLRDAMFCQNLCINMCADVCIMYKYIQGCVYVRVYACVCACACVCLSECACVYVFIKLYIHLSTLSVVNKAVQRMSSKPPVVKYSASVSVATAMHSFPPPVESSPTSLQRYVPIRNKQFKRRGKGGQKEKQTIGSKGSKES